MKIGDYVRTKYGRIGKISNLTVDYSSELILCEEISIPFSKHQIIKSSPNIIDLIEVDDYVNGHKVVEVDLDDIDDYGNDFRYIKAEHDYTLNYWIKENEIESVLTKEQFESMEYRIGE